MTASAAAACMIFVLRPCVRCNYACDGVRPFDPVCEEGREGEGREGGGGAITETRVLRMGSQARWGRYSRIMRASSYVLPRMVFSTRRTCDPEHVDQTSAFVLI